MMMEQVALRWVLYAYRAMEPVKDIFEYLKTEFPSISDDENDENGYLSLEFQEKVVEKVIHDDISERYSPQLQYIHRFLKTYVEEIDARGLEVSEYLLSELMERMIHSKVDPMQALRSDAMHHVTFGVIPPIDQVGDDDVLVTCRVASVFNEVGLKLWEAAWFLAEYCITFSEEFDDKNVIELGAGVGFTGLLLAKIARPKHVLLTDYAPEVMQNLRYNVEINSRDFRCSVEVDTLDWDTWEPTNDKEEMLPDILLAGDCVYDIAAFGSLTNVLMNFLNRKETTTSKRKRPEAIFASTIRNKKTFEAFLVHLEQKQILYEDITDISIKKMNQVLDSSNHSNNPTNNKRRLPNFFERYPNRNQIRLCRMYMAS